VKEAVHCHSQLEHPSTQQRCSFQLPRPPEPSRRSPTTVCAAPPAHSVTPSLPFTANPPIRQSVLAPFTGRSLLLPALLHLSPRPSSHTIHVPRLSLSSLRSHSASSCRLRYPWHSGCCPLTLAPAFNPALHPSKRLFLQTLSTHPHTTSPIHRDGSLHTRPPCQTGKRKSSPPNERASS